MSQGQVVANGASGTVTVTTDAECAWTASADVSWITGLSPTSGQGGGQVQFQVGANPGPSARQGDIVLNDQKAVVTQAGASCDYTLAPLTQSVAATGGQGSFTVSTAAGCTWTATSGVPWVTITAGATGSASGTVTFTAAPNTDVARLGAITVVSQTFQVTQASGIVPPVPCVFMLDSMSQSIGAGGATATVNVTTSDPSCSWTAASNAPWMTIASGATGSGPHAVSIMVASNTGSPRTGTATIAGQTFTVNEAGSCAATINPTSESPGAGGGAGTPVAVTTASGCAWTATTATPWISITSGASGNGNGILNFTTAANSGASRSGSITIAGQTLTVNQAGGCGASINPTSVTFPVAGGASGPVAVTIPAGCAWTTSAASTTWITVTSGASGTGNGTVNLTAAANTGPPRNGTVTIAGQPLAVSQGSGCSFSINPTSQNASATGGNGTQINVTTATGCTWTAAAVDSWLTVTSGASGTGNGNVNFTIASWNGPARTGTLTVAGQTATVNQASGCSFSLSSTLLDNVPSTGGTGTVTVTASNAACTWTATTTDNFITVTSGASGTGNGSVSFTVGNNGGGARTGHLTIAGITFTVNQQKH